MSEYDKNFEEAAKKILDKYDFSDILKNHVYASIYDIIEDIRSINDEVDDAVGELDIEELVDYIKEKYNVIIDSQLTYYIWWRGDKK